MRPPRDFQPGQIYGVTQRGNRGQWIYPRHEDFEEGMRLLRRYSEMHGVKVHGFGLMHNHGHWLFEASTEESISNLMRDMQGCYSRYLNKKYKATPWILLGRDFGEKISRKRRRQFSRFLRAGPVNWSPRFDAVKLEGAGFQSFLRYVELNPVRPKLVKRAADWEWSSAAAHAAGTDMDGLLCLDVWRELFGQPERAAEAWVEYVEGPGEESAANLVRLRSPRWWVSSYNRPVNWMAPPDAEVALRVGEAPS
jgi:putative transposase